MPVANSQARLTRTVMSIEGIVNLAPEAKATKRGYYKKKNAAVNMRPYQYAKVLFFASYFLILIPGSMIAIPLGFALISWCFESGLSLKLCTIGAFLGLLGIILNKKKLSNKLHIDILGFILLILPLINRLAAFPKKLGEYIGFYLPTTFFFIFFSIYVLLKYRKISN